MLKFGPWESRRETTAPAAVRVDSQSRGLHCIRVAVLESSRARGNQTAVRGFIFAKHDYTSPTDQNFDPFLHFIPRGINCLFLFPLNQVQDLEAFEPKIKV